ncbi:MAG: hypothetical protein GZ090_02485 [Oxalobacteraceae bacterium]|nr:hypothetical protein [Oxalobacteraceae bacterium]
MKTNIIATSAALVLLGCGGGSSNPPAPPDVSTPPPAVVSNTGTVDARFISSGNSRYFFSGIGLDSSGVLSANTQDSNGVMTKLNEYTLTGVPNATQEISGNADFAQGRWSQGTVTQPPQSVVLDGTTSASYHYIAINNLPTMPTTGTRTCDSGKFTHPSYISGTGTLLPSEKFGLTTGTASVVFGDAGANVTVNLSSTVGASTGNVTLNGSIPSVTSSIALNNYFGGSTSSGLITLGTAANGAVIIAAPYKMLVSNGKLYRGIASFICR